MILSNGRELIGFLPIEELYTTFAFHRRLMVFADKGVTCAACGRVGTFLVLSRDSGRKTHVDLYTDDFVLMTVDHIIPKKVCKELGLGRLIMESLDNKQPMCDPCNGAKGHKVFDEKQEESYRRQMRNNQPKQHKESQVLVSLVPNIHTLLGDPV